MRTHKHIGVHTDTREQSNVRQFLLRHLRQKARDYTTNHIFSEKEKKSFFFFFTTLNIRQASKQAQHSISRPDATKNKNHFLR